MIIINLKGGLGNQMFQYAFGRALSLKNNDTLKFDVGGLERANAVGDIYRPLGLTYFKADVTPATPDEVRNLKYPFGILSKAMRFLRAKLFRQNNINWNPAQLEQKGDRYCDGYWQTEKYFSPIRETIIQDFMPRNPIGEQALAIAKQIEETNSVSIHIRHGDYLNNPHVLKEFGVCSIDYYKNAIESIMKKYPDAKFFAFSDDISWVRENFATYENFTYVSSPAISDSEEITLMSKCKHNIIANSSFSWWGAWLNQNPSKTVIAPSPWFENNSPRDILPESWTTLPKY